MLSDEQLLAIYLPNVGSYSDVILHNLRAVEAAVRADQIEKDAALVLAWRPRGTDSYTPSSQFARAAAAIRAQLEGTTDE